MRGRKGADLRREAIQWAAAMGFSFAGNTDPSVPFDGFLFRSAVISALKLKKVRHGLGADCDIGKKFPDDVLDLRNLPVPAFVRRELWVRTQNERAYRRFYILPSMTAEIEENTAENYRNPHFREEYWRKAPYQIDFPLRREPGVAGTREASDSFPPTEGVFGSPKNSDLHGK